MLDAGQLEEQEDPLEDYDPGSDYRQSVVLVFAAIPAVALLILSAFYAWAFTACLCFSYSVLVFSAVFCREKYSLRKKWIQQQFIALLAIHLCFLLLIWYGQRIESAFAAAMPAFMTARGGRGSPLEWLISLAITAAGIFEFLLLTRILESHRPTRAPAPLPKADLKPLPDAKLTFVQDLDEPDPRTAFGKFQRVLKFLLKPLHPMDE